LTDLYKASKSDIGYLISDFFMHLETELATTFSRCNTFHTFEKYADILPPKLIRQGLEQAGVATVRKRRLPLEAVLWSVVGMSLYRQQSV
jgi:hypothetical protein